jgi:hypothetical protein
VATNIGRFSLSKHLTIAATLLGSALATSCRQNDNATWAVSARSPSGSIVASARSYDLSGPAKHPILVGVYLESYGMFGRRTPLACLKYYTDRGPNDGGASISLRWINERSLQVSLSKSLEMYLQFVKCGGIDISLVEPPT